MDVGGAGSYDRGRDGSCKRGWHIQIHLKIIKYILSFNYYLILLFNIARRTVNKHSSNTPKLNIRIGGPNRCNG